MSSLIYRHRKTCECKHNALVLIDIKSGTGKDDINNMAFLINFFHYNYLASLF